MKRGISEPLTMKNCETTGAMEHHCPLARQDVVGIASRWPTQQHDKTDRAPRRRGRCRYGRRKEKKRARIETDLFHMIDPVPINAYRIGPFNSRSDHPGQLTRRLVKPAFTGSTPCWRHY